MEQENYIGVVESFRQRTDEAFHTINDCTAREFEEAVYNYVNSYMEEYAPGTEILDVVLTGSRARGIERPDSDMDFVFAYEGEMKEDEMFNLLNRGDFSLAGVSIDINPIRAEESGTLDDYLLKAEEYLFDKLFDKISKRALYRSEVISKFSNKTYEEFHSINGLGAVDLEQAVYEYVNSVVEKEQLDVHINKVLLSGSRARGMETSESNLNFVLEYHGNVKEIDLYNLLNSNGLRINNIDIPIEIEAIRSEETGPLETYLENTERYLSTKKKEYEEGLYKRWQDAAVSYGYPFTIDESRIIFPAEYDDVFSINELKILEKMMINIMKNNQTKKQLREDIKQKELTDKLKMIEVPKVNTPKL